MSYDPKNPHYDPYTAPPVFDSSQPVTGPGYPDGGYPDAPQQGGYPDQGQYYPQQPPPGPAYNTAGYSAPPPHM